MSIIVRQNLFSFLELENSGGMQRSQGYKGEEIIEESFWLSHSISSSSNIKLLAWQWQWTGLW